MGSFNVADCLTGLSIGSREPVVAFVLEQTEGGYPKAESTRARTARLFSDICRLSSLPIHGTYDDYGIVEPADGQLAVKVACSMVGAKDWTAFEKTALDWQTGAAIQRDDVFSRAFGQESQSPKVFGLAIMHRASWDHMMAMVSQYANRASEVGEMHNVLLDAAKRMIRRRRGDDDYVQAMGVLQLERSDYTYADGRSVRLPELGSALSSGWNMYSRDFVRWLQQNVLEWAALGKHPEGPPWLDEFLGSLWDATAFRHGMEWHNRSLLSSPSAGQMRGDDRHFALALLTLQTAGERIVTYAEENGPTDCSDSFQRLLTQMDELRMKLQDKLGRALDDHPGHSPGL